MLEFSISNQTLTRLDETAVVSDSVNYLDCHFTFSPDWEGVTPVATFGHSQVAEPITVAIVDGVCRVPWEVIQPHGFSMAVYGSGKDGAGLFSHIPTDTVTVEVGKSGVAERVAPAAPTPDLYDTLMAEIQAGVAAATQAKAAAEAAQKDAGASSLSASRSERVVVNAQQECVTRAEEAKTSAEVAVDAAEGLSAEVALAAAARQELDDALVLCKSYAVGTEGYVLLLSYPYPAWDDTGTLNVDHGVGLKADRRYIVTVGGTVYEGVSHLYQTELPPLLGSDDPQAELSGWPDDGELKPEIPGGEDVNPPITPEEPSVVEDARITLVAGPLTFVQWENPDNPRTVITTTDTSVKGLTLLTDGHDNGRYYMEQARAAQKRCEAILKELQAL